MATRYIGDANSQNKFRGSADGVAPAAGYVGEVKSSVVTTATNIPGATNTFGNCANITLTAGIWRIDGSISLTRNGATFSSTDIALGITTSSTSSNLSFVEGVNYTNFVVSVPIGFTRWDFVVPSFIVRCDGSSVTRVDDNTAFAASGVLLYLKLYVAAFTTATPQFTGKITATRIA